MKPQGNAKAVKSSKAYSNMLNILKFVLCLYTGND